MSNNSDLSDLTNKNDLRLCDVLDYKTEIEGHPLVMLYAGPGSGKNFFAESFISGSEKYGIPKKTVLIITSRKSKVLETLDSDALDLDSHITGAWGNYHRYLSDSGLLDEENQAYVRTLRSNYGLYNEKVYQKSVVCTYAFIETYLKKRYLPADMTTHLWELFDLIIIDEIHSLVSEASYQNSPFYILDLIREFTFRRQYAAEHPVECEEPLCKQIIVMTGTPEPLDEIDLGQGWTVIDKRDSCRNVQPENVHFITAQNAYRQISKQLESNDKIIYFTNRTKTADEFAQDSGIDKNYITVSFSNEEKRNAMAAGDKEAFNQMEGIEQYLQKNCKLPNDTHLFVTTSRYKEGVNIENTDINCMYIESHLPCDVVQMAARVRSGVKDLYIIVDSACHPSKLSTQDAYEDEAIVREGALYNVYKNTFYPYYKLAPLCHQHGDAQHAVCQNQYSPIAAKIAHTEARYPFIRYSYFDNDFHFYEARRASVHYLYKWEHIFKRAFHSNTVHKLVQRWFPDANVEPYETPKMQARNYIRKLINENSKPEEGKHIYSKSEVDTVLSTLNEIFKTNLKSANVLFKKFSCLRFKHMSHHKNSPDYENYRLINSNTREAV